MNRHITIRPSLGQTIEDTVSQVRLAFTKAQASICIDCREVSDNFDHFMAFCEELADMLNEYVHWDLDRIENKVIVLLNDQAPMADKYSRYEQEKKNLLAISVAICIGQRAIASYDPKDRRIV